MRKFVCIIILCCISTLSLAQKDTLVIEIGSKLIDGLNIKPYTNKWEVTYVDSAGRATPNRIWLDLGQIIEVSGKKYFYRVQDLYSPDMRLLSTWVNRVNLTTLAPEIFFTLSPSGQFSHYQFKGSQVVGVTNNLQTGEISKLDTTFTSPLFDWNLYGMLLVGLPLKTGLVAMLPYFDSNTNSQQWLSIYVEHEENIKSNNDTTYQTYKVVTNKNLTFWVSNSAPYVIKLELYLKNNSKLVWDMY